MTRDEIVAIIKQRLGNYNDSTIDAHIVTEMKLNQDLLEQEASLPWFLLDWAEVAVAAGGSTNTTRLALDRSGTTCLFLAENEEIMLGTYLASETITLWSSMRKVDQQTFIDTRRAGLYDANAYGHPSKYIAATSGGVGFFSVTPTPIVAWNLVGHGYYADVPLDTDITNLWLTYAPDLVIAKVGLIIANFYTALTKFVPAFEKELQKAERRLAKINALKTEENIRRMMGDS